MQSVVFALHFPVWYGIQYEEKHQLTRSLHTTCQGECIPRAHCATARRLAEAEGCAATYDVGQQQALGKPRCLAPLILRRHSCKS